MPERIQLRRAKGWRMPPNTVKVDRSTIWGNPYRVGNIMSVKLMRTWCWKIKRPDLTECVDAAEAARRFRETLAYDHASQYAIRKHLAGKNLACWCPLDRPCHADVLLEIANKPETK